MIFPREGEEDIEPKKEAASFRVSVHWKPAKMGSGERLSTKNASVKCGEDSLAYTQIIPLIWVQSTKQIRVHP